MRNKEKVMKKFLIGCATAAMMLSPAIAEAGGRHGGGNDWIGPVIFGTVLGVIITSIVKPAFHYCLQPQFRKVRNTDHCWTKRMLLTAACCKCCVLTSI